MRRQILNADGTLNIYVVTVTGTTTRGVVTETFPFTLQVDKTDAHGQARGMWQSLNKERTCYDMRSIIDEHEVLGEELSTADRIRNAQDEIRNAVEQHFDNKNGEHYAILNARLDPAITALLKLVQ